MADVTDTPSVARGDHDSAEPTYLRVVRALAEQIATGQYRPGDQLPSEAQLCAQFNVSPMTARRAVNILLDRRLAMATKGKGTYVRALDMREAAFHMEERRSGVVPGPDSEVRLLKAAIQRADERVARKLVVAPGTRVVYLCRLVLDARGPSMYHREYTLYDPRRPLVEAELKITSLEGLFLGRGDQGLRCGDLDLEPIALKEEEAEWLEEPAGSPALSLEHVFYDFANHPVAWGWFICRPGRFHLISRIGPAAV